MRALLQFLFVFDSFISALPAIPVLMANTSTKEMLPSNDGASNETVTF